MKPFKYLSLAIVATVACISTFGFECSKMPDNTFLTMKRFSSIPPVMRWVKFSADCKVTILDPPKTDNPFTYDMTKSECDSLESLCAQYQSFDTLYVDTNMRIPNPANIVLEFTYNGVSKNVTIVQFPKIATGAAAVLECAGRIEKRGLEMMEQREIEKQKKEKEENEENGQN